MDTESEAEKQDANDGIGASGDSDSDEFPELNSETLKNLPRLGPSSSKTALSRKGKGIKLQGTSRPAPKRAASEDCTGAKKKPAGDRPKKSAEEKAREKEEKAIQRELEKRRKQDEKDKAKLDRLADKEKERALADVNKIRTDKKISTPEMIVDLPGSLDRVVRLQTEELLKDLKVDCTEWTPPLPNAIRWRRKVVSRYNEALGYWEPRPLTIETEKTALVVMSAQQFVDLAMGAGDTSLDAHAKSVTQHFPSHNRLYLVEGLELWFRKNATLRNRAFAAQVRAGLSAGEPVTAALSRAQSQKTQVLDESLVRAAMINLQVDHSFLVHHTDSPLATSQWIVKFTEFLSTAPYRKQREAVNLASAGFCMESGQVRAGDSAEDTFRRVLQHQARITPAMAQGIVNEFRTARGMVRALEEKGPAALEHVRKGTNKDGGFTDRTVGPSASRRMHRVWTGRAEGSTDI
ncbi:crossover junction endonuclease eme1 [Podospora conica]|nr:crossover junction endonuclease eme1 [Schizothecium conicum]